MSGENLIEAKGRAEMWDGMGICGEATRKRISFELYMNKMINKKRNILMGNAEVLVLEKELSSLEDMSHSFENISDHLQV